MVESEVVRKTTIRTLPVETIEWMKHRKDNRGAQVRTHAKGYIVDGKEMWKCQTNMIKRKVYCQMWVKSKGKCQER
jgi:hypothetical protein